jgi:pimeloyl-ACP methyl ester carboxylesterase
MPIVHIHGLPNSLGCPLIVELAATHPDRVESAVLVSPAGGPMNQPLVRALGQMALGSYREPPSMVPIAVTDYLRFGPQLPRARPLGARADRRAGGRVHRRAAARDEHRSPNRRQ